VTSSTFFSYQLLTAVAAATTVTTTIETEIIAACQAYLSIERADV